MSSVSPWAHRIRAERTARGWSQADAVRALRSYADGRCPSQENVLRQWKGWESGEVEPGSFYRPLIARTFGTVTTALFPPARSSDEAPAAMAMDEIVARLRMSDVSPATLEALRATTDRLACEYSARPADDLVVEAGRWLGWLTDLTGRRLTLAQHREVLALAGQLALLVGCLEYDLGRTGAAEVTRQAALSLGEECGHADVIGWAHEMRAWYALTQGTHRDAIAAADAGLAAVGQGRGVAVQLAAHKAKAAARVGLVDEVRVALERGRELLEALPYPSNPDNHFVVDPEKFAFYTMDCYRLIGADALAAAHADEVIRSVTDESGVVRKPMRVAEAEITLGVVAARSGDPAAAVGYGRRALERSRRSMPSLSMHAGELRATLHHLYPGSKLIEAFEADLRAGG